MSKALYSVIYLSASMLTVLLLTTRYYYLAPAPGALLLLLFIIWRRPEWGFYAIIFLVPYTAYTSLSAYKYLSISKFLGLALAAIIFFNALLSGKREIPIKSNIWNPLLVFFIVSIISTIFSPYFPAPLNDIRLLISAYFLFAMVIILGSARLFEEDLPKVIIVSITISSLLSIYGYFFNSAMFAMDVTGETLKRGIGGVNNPNHFAAMVIFSIPLICYKVLHPSEKSTRLFYLGVLATNLVSVMLTFSRSGAVVLAATLLLVGLEYYKKLTPRSVGLALAAVLAVIAAAAVFVPHEYWTRQLSLAQGGGDHSISRRQSYLTVATSAFEKKPLLGYGPGTFDSIYAESELSRRYGKKLVDRSRDAHNTYVETAIGGGAISLIIFLYIIFKALRNFHVARKNFKETGLHNLFHLTAAYRASFISVLFYFFLLSRFTFKYFWLSLALSQVALILSRSQLSKDLE